MKKKQNRRTEFLEENREKRKYISPNLEVIIVKMEDSISASSATVLPINASNQVQEDWTDGTNETNNIPW